MPEHPASFIHPDGMAPALVKHQHHRPAANLTIVIHLRRKLVRRRHHDLKHLETSRAGDIRRFHHQSAIRSSHLSAGACGRLAPGIDLGFSAAFLRICSITSGGIWDALRTPAGTGVVVGVSRNDHL